MSKQRITSAPFREKARSATIAERMSKPTVRSQSSIPQKTIKRRTERPNSVAHLKRLMTTASFERMLKLRLAPGVGSTNFNDQRIAPMAKGQIRSNREARKPKQEKAAVKTEASFAGQIKAASRSAPQGGKHKS
ncbi:hypothetical protein [Rhizobium freirei]|uniref:hypothetical protein n=1 Tax=Rhizobium freirei TaxID=1353277 RepID=UPI0012FC1474|nr:hypothetical protein [Rhizobium freirei]